jgi:hypothetical protein
MSTTHSAYATACGRGSTEGGAGRAAQPNKELLLSACGLVAARWRTRNCGSRIPIR